MEKGEKERPKNALLTAVVGTLLHLAEKNTRKQCTFILRKVIQPLLVWEESPLSNKGKEESP